MKMNELKDKLLTENNQISKHTLLSGPFSTSNTVSHVKDRTQDMHFFLQGLARLIRFAKRKLVSDFVNTADWKARGDGIDVQLPRLGWGLNQALRNNDVQASSHGSVWTTKQHT